MFHRATALSIATTARVAIPGRRAVTKGAPNGDEKRRENDEVVVMVSSGSMR